jgi:hypothetical protein
MARAINDDIAIKATSIEVSYLKSNSEIVGPRLQIKDTLVIS